MNIKIFALFALILCSGCSKAEMSDARLNHLLANDHGWIDLTVKSPPPSKEKPIQNDCSVTFSVNGERLLREDANFIAANSNGSPVGYRFPVPSGQIDVELVYSLCVPQPLVIKQSLNLLKDHLAVVTFDGGALKVEGMSKYNPASLEAVRSQLEGVRSDAANADQRLSNTNSLVLICLALNVVALVLLLWRRRRAA